MTVLVFVLVVCSGEIAFWGGDEVGDGEMVSSV